MVVRSCQAGQAKFEVRWVDMRHGATETGDIGTLLSLVLR